MGVIYGVIRGEPGLPSRDAQILAVERAGAEVLLEHGDDARSAQRIRRVLSRLQPGDELVVHDLSILGQGVEMLLNLRLAVDRNARVRVAEAALALDADTSLRRLLDLVTPRSGEAQRTVSQGGSRNPLSPYQIGYARRLQRQGHSLRAIGLLFQVTPREVARMLATY